MICSRQDALRAAAGRLAAAGVEAPAREARLLLQALLGIDRAALLRDARLPVDPIAFGALLDRRIAREPLAYITGTREFWSLPFHVSPATLIPRPDSETLIEAAQAAMPDRDRVRAVLDLGTGTGCLLIAALTEYPRARGVGVDRVPEAAALARRNAGALGVGGRVAVLVGDWAASIGGAFDLVLCNPPYVASGALAGLAPEVARFEPGSALDGGASGLDAYRAVIPDLRRLLRPGGIAVLEIGMGQGGAVAALAAAAGFAVETRADLAGIDRALVLRGGGG